MKCNLRYIYTPAYEMNDKNEFSEHRNTAFIGATYLFDTNPREVIDTLKFMKDNKIYLSFNESDFDTTPCADIEIGDNSYFYITDFIVSSNALLREEELDKEPVFDIHIYVDDVIW